MPDAEAGPSYATPGVKADIWEAIERPRAVEELVTLVADVYDVTPEKAREDLEVFLNEAQAAGVVQMVGP